MFVVPGPFVPYNDTITLLTYKRLRNLDLDMDVFAFKGKEDKGLFQELEKDENFKKFHITYTSEVDHAIARNHPWRLPESLLLMYKYIQDSVKEFEKGNYKYLFTSIVPGISHLCGKAIKRKHPEVIWYASFSDPFKNSPYKKADLEGRSIFYKFVYSVGGFVLYNSKFEEAAVLNADKLIFICEEQMEYTLGQYKNTEELKKKAIIMPLTFIPEWEMYSSLINDKKIVSNKPLQAVHLGRLYGLRKINTFLEALKELKEEDKDLGKKIVFHQYSEIQAPDVKKIKEYGLEDVFILHKTVSYDKSVEVMKESDILVLFDTLMSDKPVQPYLPSKIVEYLLLRKPILGICDKNSPSYRILKEHGFNEVGSDVESIKLNIKRLTEGVSIEEYSIADLNSDMYNMLEL